LERVLNSFQLQCLDYENIRDVMTDVPPEILEGFSLAESLAPILAVGLSGNPRQTKRFLNTLKMRVEMARARGITLNLRKLAKLMLLEYFQTEAFKQLAELQASQEGKPRVLELLEQKRELTSFMYDVSSAPGEEKEENKETGKRKSVTREETSKAEMPVETPPLEEDERTMFDAWQVDKWIRVWLSIEPVMSGIDLRPYFYFSRDNLAFNVSTVRRMSPDAQKILTDLLGESEIIRRKALVSAKSINLADANSIFSSLADRFKNNDDTRIKDSILKLMFDFVEQRKDNISQIILFLRGVQENTIPIVAPVRLAAISAGRDEEKITDALLQGWAANKVNSILAKSASAEIAKKAKRNP